MDTYASDDEYSFKVTQESLPDDGRTRAESFAWWALVDCLRADEHVCPPGTPAREMTAARYERELFSEETSAELWRNRTVTE